MTGPSPVRVVGVGSPLGDDALAWEVVRRLEMQPGVPEGVEFHTLEGGQRLLDVLDGQGTLLLIDALAPGTSPGSVQRFEWPDPRVEVLRPGSTHVVTPAEALRLAAVLGLLPPRVLIFALEAALDQGQGLSPAVASALPGLVQCIADELAEPSLDSLG